MGEDESPIVLIVVGGYGGTELCGGHRQFLGDFWKLASDVGGLSAIDGYVVQLSLLIETKLLIADTEVSFPEGEQGPVWPRDLLSEKQRFEIFSVERLRRQERNVTERGEGRKDVHHAGNLIDLEAGGNFPGASNKERARLEEHTPLSQIRGTHF